MSDLSVRRARLSAAKRALLERWAEQERVGLPLPETTPAGAVAGRLRAEPVRIPRRAAGEPLRLSFAQERLWFLDQLAPGRALYNVAAHRRFSGALRVEVLRGALRELVRRHETLRTTFAAADPFALQVIGEPAPTELGVVDLAALPAAARQPEAMRIAAAEAARPFDLARGPLLRARLLRLAAQDHLLLLCLHHIVTDGWSMGVLASDLAALYDAGAAGLPSPLPELPIQYGDYALWQRQALANGELAGELAFWKRRLAGASGDLALPFDRPRPSSPTYRGGRVSAALPASAALGLRQLCRGEGCTLFMGGLALLCALLARYSGQEDLCVGTPVAGRHELATERLIGLFVNTLVLRAEVAPELSFRALLAAARETLLAAEAHHRLPFEQLVEELRPERRPGANPLFGVMYLLESIPTPGEPPAGEPPAEAAASPAEGVARFDLCLTLVDAGRLGAALDFSRDLFDRVTARRLLGHLERLLASAVAVPDRRASELSLLADEERWQVVAEWNAAAACSGGGGGELCLHELFAARAAAAPAAPAVSFQGETLSYGELERRANRLAHRLRRLDVGPEVRVGICLERSLELVVSILAVLKAGGAYVPMDPDDPPARLALLAEDSGIAALITLAALRGRVPGHSPAVLCLDGPAAAATAESELPPAAGARLDNLAYVIYTSGSTGRPKGVQVSHGNVVRLLAATAAGVRFGAGDVWTLFHSFAFDFSVWELWGALAHGGRLVVVPYWVSRSPLDCWRLLASEGVTVLNQTPSAFRQLVEALAADGVAADACSRLRLIIFGGEAIEPGSLAAWMARQGQRRPRLVNMYGITETTVHVTWRPLAASDLGGPVNPIGRPIADLAVFVLDRHLAPVPAGATGEIYVAGEGVARGYLGQPALTAERFLPNPFSGLAGASPAGSRLYRSGDLARCLADGQLAYLGRADHQVKLRGYRIETGEIERALEAHPAVRQAVVAARRDGPAGETRLVAYVVPRPGTAALAPAALRAWLRERLAAHMVPAAIVELAALPLLPSGKVDRRALLAVPAAGREEDEAGGRGPRTPVEEVVAGIWCEVLRWPRVGMEQSFFDLGGHSLLATQVMARLRAALAVELPLRVLFESPTVAALARAAEHELRRGATVRLPPLTAVPRGRPLPLSFAQQRLWFLAELEPASPAYNLPVARQLDGELDLAAMARALREVVRRHEALRTRFVVRDGEPEQVVDPPPPAALPLIDLAALPAAPQAAELARLAADAALRPFDLARGPLLRAGLARLAPDRHWLLVTMHHIVGDGWSLAVFERELSALYEAFALGLGSPLPELAVQYADFAVWQRAWLGGEVLDRLLAYWRERLAGAPAALCLPVDRPRAPAPSGRGVRCGGPLPAALAAGLRQLGSREGATLAMIMLAALAALLYRYTGERDVVLGTPTAGRKRLELEPLIGFFVNTLVLRLQAAGEMSLRQLLARARAALLEAHAHDELPFEKLVEELRPERTLGQSPLFRVMLATEEAAAGVPGGVEGRAAGASPPARRSLPVKFDLALVVAPRGEGLETAFDYRQELFDAATVERARCHLERLLESAVAAPESRLAEVPLLAEAERRQLLGGWAEEVEAVAGGGAPGCLHELVAAAAALAPEATAIWAEGEQLSYAELARRYGELALRLRGMGIGPEAPVGVCLERSPELIVSLLGVLAAGGVYLPLDPAWPPARRAAMLSGAGARVLLTRRAAAEEAAVAGLAVADPAAAAAGTLQPAAAAPAAAGKPPAGAPVLPGNLAYVIYTSGSTGEPKAVAVEHGAAAFHLAAVRRGYGLGPADRVLQFASPGFDAAVEQILAPLTCGATLVLRAPGLPTPPELLASLGRLGVTVANLPTAYWQEWMGERREATGPPAAPGLRLLIVGGEAMGGEAARRFRRSALGGVRLLNAYGPTEAVVTATLYDLAGWEAPAAPAAAGSVPIGRPLAARCGRVLDPDGARLPAGVPGELCLGGVLARGYLGRPELTAERFVPDGWSQVPGERLYRTGDRVRLLPDGNLEHLGRMDRQIKLRGVRIEPGEVEAALAAHPGVAGAAVLARSDGGAEPVLVAYAVAAPEEGSVTATDLRLFLQRRLPEAMVPRHVVLLPRLPTTPTGKLDRRALPEPAPLAAGAAEEPMVGAPRDLLELRLLRIWEEVLGRERAGVKEDFFELGGHSLLAVRLMARIRRELGCDLPLAVLFQHGTVERLAAVLRGGAARAAAASGGLIEMQAGGTGAPLILVHPVGGGVLCYGELVRQLGRERPLWGIEAALVEPAGAAPPRLEELARGYVGLLRRSLPEGPYALGGWSMGGPLALEMARELAAQGQPVSLLAMLDPAVPGDGEDAVAAAEPLAWRFGRDLAASFGRTLPPPPPGVRSSAEALGWLREQGRRAGLLPAMDPAAEAAELARRFALFERHAGALAAYRPAPYAGRTALLMPAAPARKVAARRRAWRRRLTGEVVAASLPGDHYSWLRPPHVAALAAALREAVAAAEKER